MVWHDTETMFRALPESDDGRARGDTKRPAFRILSLTFPRFGGRPLTYWARRDPASKRAQLP